MRGAPVVGRQTVIDERAVVRERPAVPAEPDVESSSGVALSDARYSISGCGRRSGAVSPSGRATTALEGDVGEQDAFGVAGAVMPRVKHRVTSCRTSSSPASAALSSAPSRGAPGPRRPPRRFAPGSMRTRRAAGSRTSIAFIVDRSMTMPPSLVERPLRACRSLRIDSGTAWRRANATASLMSPAVRTGKDQPGGPARIAEERFLAYARSPGSSAAAATPGGRPSWSIPSRRSDEGFAPIGRVGVERTIAFRRIPLRQFVGADASDRPASDAAGPEIGAIC
jgi:hypothetical protein